MSRPGPDPTSRSRRFRRPSRPRPRRRGRSCGSTAAAAAAVAGVVEDHRGDEGAEQVVDDLGAVLADVDGVEPELLVQVLLDGEHPLDPPGLGRLDARRPATAEDGADAARGVGLELRRRGRRRRARSRPEARPPAAWAPSRRSNSASVMARPGQAGPALGTRNPAASRRAAHRSSPLPGSAPVRCAQSRPASPIALHDPRSDLLIRSIQSPHRRLDRPGSSAARRRPRRSAGCRLPRGTPAPPRDTPRPRR